MSNNVYPFPGIPTTTDGNPSEALKASNEDRLLNWRLLQELAGVI